MGGLPHKNLLTSPIGIGHVSKALHLCRRIWLPLLYSFQQNGLIVSTVLVIDDEKAIVEMLYRALTRFGYAVLTAFSGREGIEIFDQSAIDVVVTDLLMPGLDGVEVLRHVRQSRHKDIPVIAMSGTPNLLGNHDFDLVISKPFSIYELLDHVRYVCPPDAGRVNCDENG